MAAPWERYQKKDGPWARYQKPKKTVEELTPGINLDPLDGAGRGERVAAGFGQSYADAWRRVKQLSTTASPVPLLAGMLPGDPFGIQQYRDETQAEIDQASKDDARLLDDPYGMGGAVLGNISQVVAPATLATRIPQTAALGRTILNPRLVSSATGLSGATRGIGAAGVIGGAEAGLTEPVASGESELGNIGSGFLWGMGGQGIGEVIGAVARPTARLFTRGRQAEATAGDIIRSSATSPTTIPLLTRGPAPAPIVPGSMPTTAEAYRDPGLAGLERTLRTMPEYAPRFVERDAARNAARVGLLETRFNGATAEDAGRLRSATADAQSPVIRDVMKANGAETARVITSLDRSVNAPRFRNAPAAQEAIAKVRGLLVTPLDDSDRLRVGRELITDAVQNRGRMSGADYDKMLEAARLVRGAANRGDSADDVAKGLLKIKPESKNALQQLRGVARAMARTEKGKDDVASLYNARKYITGTLMRGANSEQMFAYRGAVKKIDDAIVGVAPQFKGYLRDYASGMRKADQAEVGARLLASGRARPSDMQAGWQLGAGTVRAVNNLDQVVRSATGFDRATAAKTLTPEQVKAAQDIARDIDSYAWVLQQSRATQNSITPESLAGQGRFGSMAREAAATVVPGGNMTVAAVDTVLNDIGRNQGQRVQEIVAEAMLNPSRAAEILAVLPPDVRREVVRIAGPTLGQMRLTTTGALGFSGAAAAAEQPEN